MKKLFSFMMVILAAVLIEIMAPFKWYWQRATEGGTARKAVMAMPLICAADSPRDAEITVTNGAAGATAGSDTAAIQLKGENGQDLVGVGVIFFYLSTDAAGQVLAVNSTDLTALAIGTDGTVIEWSTNVSGVLISESDGDIDLALTVASGKTVYLQLIMPDGRLVTSDAMTYATS